MSSLAPFLCNFNRWPLKLDFDLTKIYVLADVIISFKYFKWSVDILDSGLYLGLAIFSIKPVPTKPPVPRYWIGGLGKFGKSLLIL